MRDCWEKDPLKKLKRSNDKAQANISNSNRQTHTSSNSNPISNSSTSSPFKVKCPYCQIVGHKESECQKKKRDQREMAAATTASVTGNQLFLYSTIRNQTGTM